MGQIGTSAHPAGPVQSGRVTVITITIACQAPCVEQITAKRFGHKLMKELIVAFQTRLQVSRSRFWILGLYGLESPYSSFLPTVPGLVLDGSH